MKIETVPVTDLTPHPQNARAHSEANIQAIASSLTEFGQTKPIVVGKNNHVLAGCGTLQAAKRLAWETIGIVRVDLPSDMELAYAVADNKTTDMSEFDFEKLSVVMRGLEEGGTDLDVTAFSEYERSPLLEGTFNEPEETEMPAAPKAEDQPVRFSFPQWEYVKVAMGVTRRDAQGDLSNAEAITKLCREFTEGKGL